MKISVIMQSYLGDYFNSRKDSVLKFKRAINSFLSQTNKDTELIIAADGCDLTKTTYYENWSNNNRIKFIYVDSTERMYNKKDNMIFYRGIPRQYAKEIATGDIITYMDSDDFIIPNYLEYLQKYWIENPKLDWIINMSWFDNMEIINNPTFGYYDVYESQNINDIQKIDGLDSFWIKAKVKNGLLVMSPALTSHKKHCQTKWEDLYSDKQSEDQLFSRKLRAEYKNGALIDLTGYVRCHLKTRWDY